MRIEVSRSFSLRKGKQKIKDKIRNVVVVVSGWNPKNFKILHSISLIFLKKMTTSLVADVTKDVNTRVNVVFEEEDLPFEEELLRNPHSLKAWLRYIEAREDAPNSKLNLLYERALKVRSMCVQFHENLFQE